MPDPTTLLICATVVLCLWLLRGPVQRAIETQLDIRDLSSAQEAVEAAVERLTTEWQTARTELGRTAQALEADAERSRKDREAARMHLARISKTQQELEAAKGRSPEAGGGDEAEYQRWLAAQMGGSGADG